MRRMRGFLILLLLLGFSSTALFAGSIEAYRFDDPVKEARYKVLIEELRCLVCQNQNLADSNAELAQDMRRLTYDMVRRGASNEEVSTYMVQRYGDFVLYLPPFKTSTALLWTGPFILLVASVLVLILFVRRRNREVVPELTRADHESIQRLLNQVKKDNES